MASDSGTGPGIGDRAPVIDRLDHRGRRVHVAPGLSTGPWVVYFYPRDGTPVCTRQACSFRDRLNDFSALQARVIGVSADDNERHRDFADQHDLDFPLLADLDGQLSKAFGVGRALGVLGNRVTFVIDTNAVVVMRYQAQLAAAKHVAKAVEALRALSA